MNRSRPQTQLFHGREQAQNRPQMRFVHVRKQSTATTSPRQKARQQTVRIRERTTDTAVREQASAMGAIRPQTVRNLALSTSTIAPLTNIGREPRPAKNCPSRRIVVSVFPPISFPVHIRNIPAHVFI